MALEDAIKEMEKVTKSLSASTEAPAKTVEVDPEGFIRHVTKHMAALNDDTPEVRDARVAYLQQCIEVAKNFEGMNGTPSMISLNVFKAPEQVKTTETTKPITANKSGGTAPTTHGSDVQPAGTPTAPSGKIAPGEASASGAPFAGGHFAKALDGLTSAIADVKKAIAGETSEEAPKGEAKSKGKEETAKTEGADESGSEETPETKTEGSDESDGENVEKSMAVAFTDVHHDVFPLDMNDEDLEVTKKPHFFGFDKGGKLEKRFKASQDTAE